MTPGPMEFRGPMRGPICFRKAIGFSDSEDLAFFFGDHLILAGKTVKIPVKTFCFCFFLFGDHLILAGKPLKFR